MVPVARKNLFREKTRLIISVLGVAFAVLLILVVQSLYQGFQAAAGSFIRELPADAWVVQHGSFDLFHSPSVLPAELHDTLAERNDVESVAPVLGRQMRVQINGSTDALFFFAPAAELPGEMPIEAVEGTEQPSKGEVVIDSVFAQRNGLALHDQIDAGNHNLTVVGISGGGNAILSQFAFITPDDALEIFGQPGLVNFYLVTLADPASPPDVASRLQTEISGVTVFTTEQFADESAREVVDVFLPVVGVLVFIGFLIGAAIIGLTIYTATVEKAREYAVLKAIGASPRFLYRIIFGQSLIVGTLGSILGLLGAIGINVVAGRLVPEFVTDMTWALAIWVVLAAVIMSVLAAVLPIQRITRVEPAAVFRA